MDSPATLADRADACRRLGRPEPRRSAPAAAAGARSCSTAAGGGARVVVRDGAGKVVFTGELAFGQQPTGCQVSPPVRIQSTDGALEVTAWTGQDRGAHGARRVEPAQDVSRS